jgi:hypothetical protein
MNLGPGAARPKLNCVEEWELVNTTADAHPILATSKPLLPDTPPQRYPRGLELPRHPCRGVR